ncbi:MAG: hypothetical protein NC099_05830 [Corallococcus sp.]|nr:hypothetical protein [Bacillota bacterium]MCM1534154.1 hypothetical protein [Corallococcus sp.]
MEASVRKTTILQSIKAGVLSLVFSCIGVLLLALIAKLCNIGDSVLPIVNQVLKAVAVGIGTAISVKDEKFLIKAIIGALIFGLLSMAVFLIMGGKFSFGQVALDFGIALAVAIVVALIKSRKAA